MAAGCIGDEPGERGDEEREVGCGFSGKEDGHVGVPSWSRELSPRRV